VGQPKGKKNPITPQELELFKRSVHIGDKLKYRERVCDEIAGVCMIKFRKMEVVGIYPHIVILRGKNKYGITIERSMTWQEACIINSNRPQEHLDEEIRKRAESDAKGCTKVILELFDMGLTKVEIAKQTGYSYDKVKAVTATRGKNCLKKLDYGKIISLRKQGFSYRVISEKTGASESSVRRILKKEKVK
jgi:hypothetical protein